MPQLSISIRDCVKLTRIRYVFYHLKLKITFEKNYRNYFMKVTFLGTGTSQGVPVIACQCDVCRHGGPFDKRLRASVLIETENRTFVIDSGPDFRQQMLKEDVTKLDGILVTHHHKDHIGGMDDVRSYNWVQKRPMDVYASEQSQMIIKSDFFYAFDEFDYPGVPSFALHTIGTEPFDVHGVKVIPIEGLHYTLPVLGFRIGDFAYITDMNFLPAREMVKLLDCKVIVLNALRRKYHFSHFTLEQAVEILEFLRPEKAYLTHISHKMGFHEEVNKELPDFIRLSYDGLKIEV